MPNPGNSPTHGFTLAEDAALKNRLRHISVHDDREDPRECQVFFRFPDAVTEKTYPFITIELVDIQHARERQDSERYYYYSSDPDASMTYYPSEYDEVDLAAQLLASDGEYLRIEQNVPVDLIYQVTTYARSQRHDRQITMLLMRRVFPLRRGFIDIPEDGTIRRCDLLDYQQTDVLDKETAYHKRIFRNVFTVRINAEIPQSDIFDLRQVLEVDGTIEDYDPAPTVPLSTDFEENF